ncbi:hypothetical protein LR48_Vigan08g070300 [Vigna angularis]|uniref:Rx N-terminal domain-containing protein n=1 Tax=Phaseolus angularis TaxID=3914 RepID=A0A0L9V4F0_PHAAN|nr:hypothetical protein LR48_Vigan08g070300 [Vigna angularis]
MPVLETLGGALFGAVLQVLFDKLDSHQVLSYFHRRNLDEKLLKKLKRKLMDVNAVIDDAEEKQFSNPLVKEWLDEVRDALYDAEDLLEQIHYVSKSELKAEFQSSATKVCSFESKMIEVLDDLESLLDQKVVQAFKISSNVGSGLGNKVLERKNESSSLVAEDVIYGRDEEKEMILNWLTSDNSNNKQLVILSIVGMGGMGKTTLAQHVYNDTKFKEAKFELKAWATTRWFRCWRRDLMQSRRLMEEALRDVDGGGVVTGDATSMAESRLGSENGEDERRLRMMRCRACVNGGDARHGRAMVAVEVDGKVGDGGGADGEATTSWFRCRRRDLMQSRRLMEVALRDVDGGGVVTGDAASMAESRLGSENGEDERRLRMMRCRAFVNGGDARHGGAMVAVEVDGKVGDGGGADGDAARGFTEMMFWSWRRLAALAGAGRRLGFQWVKDDAHVLGLRCHGWLGVDRAKTVPKRTRHFSAVRDPVEFSTVQCHEYRSLCDATRLRTFSSTSMDCGMSIQELISNFKFLRLLSLNGCDNIKEVPDSVGNLIHLRSLDLSGTDIERLPDSTCSLRNLQVLKLNDCDNLQELPSTLHELTNLRRLELMETTLRKVPVHLGKLKNLRVWMDSLLVGEISERSRSLMDNRQLQILKML